MKFNLPLRDPNPTDGGGAAAAAAAASAKPQADAMDAVLEKLNLPKELKGTEENPKPEIRNPKETEAERQAAAEVAEQARVAGLTPEEKAAEEAAAQSQAATETFLETLTAEDRAALDAMPEEERAATIERLKAEDQESGEGEKVPEFTPEQKAWVETQQATVKQELDAAKAEVERLKGEVQAAATNPVQAANVHPMFLEDDARKIDEMDAQFSSFERWALANWDGTQEVEAQGNQAAIPAYSGAQIRERYAAVKEMREKMVPAAKQAIQQRAQQQAVARQQYPELFDGKRAESKLAQEILRMAPALKVIFPNIWTVIGDALVGEKIRIAKAKDQKTKGLRDPKANRIAPRVAPRPSAGNRIAAGGKPKKEDGISAKRFHELGGDRNALVQMLQNADLPMATKEAA